ncbi:MAG: alpha-amylase family glycosyl hydrolase [Terriglobia bacterium]
MWYPHAKGKRTHMINLDEVGAFGSVDARGALNVRFGVYLPGLRATDGFEVIVRIIHRDDRFDPAIPPQNFALAWTSGHPLDLWSSTIPIHPLANTHFGQQGTYLYRYQLWWTPPGGSRQLVTSWFTDPFARATDVGELSAFMLTSTSAPFTWTDAAYKSPELDDLVVYELQVEEFNGTFDGVADRLVYLQSLGVNCLELMPVTSTKLDFDWGYGPLHYFAPNARFGGADGLKRLVDACHAAGMAVILDVVYQHVDPAFAYDLVYANVNNTPGAPKVPSPMIGANGPFGPQSDFSQPFTQEYFLTSNRIWLDDYHVDGFRYDEVTDLYTGPTDDAYAKLAYDTYQYSLGVNRFQQGSGSYSRIIQCAEALSKARDVLRNTYTSCAWQDDLLNKSEDMMQWNYVDANFAHLLDPLFSGYPDTKTVDNAAGDPVDMPVAPFQYLETHDHSQLIVFAGTEPDGFFPPGDRSRFYKLQPFAVALYTCQGVPMLWQGQEFADNYHLPGGGSARVGLRRDMHWEYFYDDYGSPLVRLYRRLGLLRRTYGALRSRESYYYYQQSLQANRIIAYHRHAPATPSQPEEFALVLLNFSDAAGSISIPFPKAGTWQEMVDADIHAQTITVPADGAGQTITVPSNYGWVWVWTA